MAAPTPEAMRSRRRTASRQQPDPGHRPEKRAQRPAPGQVQAQVRVRAPELDPELEPAPVQVPELGPERVPVPALELDRERGLLVVQVQQAETRERVAPLVAVVELQI